MAIDFMAIAKGRELANDQNWQDRVRQEQAKVYDYNTRGREISGIQRDQQFDLGQTAQEAAAYLAPLLSNRQRAADAGVDDVEWMLRQRDTILNDPNFLSKTPEAQQKILEQLGTSANLIAQARLNSGDATAAQRLLGAFGNNSSINAFDSAINSGDPDAILTAAGYKADANGMVDVGGTLVPKVVAANSIASARRASGILPAAAQTYQQNEAKTAAQLLVDEQKQQQMSKNISDFIIGGWRPDANGVYTNAGQPGQAFKIDINGVAPVTTPGAAPGAAPAAAAAVPGTPGSPAAVALLQPNANGILPVPAALSPEVSTIRTALPQLEATVSALVLKRKELEAAQKANSDFVAKIGMGFNARTNPEGYDMQQALYKQVEDRGNEVKALEAQLGTLSLAKTQAGTSLQARQAAAVDIGQELVRGYTNIGNDEKALADFMRKYPAQIGTVVAQLNAEVQRVQQRVNATTVAADKAALLQYARRLGTAIGNFSRKQ